jgi:hypothetical protein
MAEDHNDVVIDPTFFLPPDVIDMRAGYEDDIEDGDADVSYDDILDVDDLDDVSPTDEPVVDDQPDNSGSLPTPNNFSVVEQHVRIAPDGKAVVDVVIEFVDGGQFEYDIRVTKVVA